MLTKALSKTLPVCQTLRLPLLPGTPGSPALPAPRLQQLSGLSCSLSKNKQYCPHVTSSLLQSIVKESCFERTEYALLFQQGIYILSTFKQKQGGKCVPLAWTTPAQSHSKNYVFRKAARVAINIWTSCHFPLMFFQG